MKYRVYADGSIAVEDDFEAYDNSIPYYDDYREVDVPEELEDYLIELGVIAAKVL